MKRRDIIWNYLGTAFNMGMGAIILPFLLRYLSNDELGLWYVFMSYAGIANLFTFGFTPAFSRNIAYCWNGASELKKTAKSTKKVNEIFDYKLFREVLVTSKILYLIIAVFATLGIYEIGIVHIKMISKEIFNFDIKFCWFVFVIAIFLNLYYGYYNSYVIGIGKIKESNQVLVLAGIIRITAMFLLMIMGYGLPGACIAYLVYGFFYRCLNKIIFERELKRKLKMHVEADTVKVSLEQIIKCFKVIWYNAWRDGAVSISEYCSTQLGTLVCSSFLSLSNTAMFSLTTQLVGMAGKVAKSIHNAYTPEFQRAYIKGEKHHLRNAQAFCVYFFIIIYGIEILALVIIGLPIIKIIKSDAFLNVYFVIVYGIYQFMLSYRNCYGAYLSCTNRVSYWKAYIITSLFSVMLYTILLQTTHLGVWCIVVSGIICEAVYNFWKWPDFVNKELDLSITEIFKIGKVQLKKIFLY